MNKSETHVVTGMSRDLTVTRFNPNLVVDARNIRITSKDGNSTLLVVTNEKGTKSITPSGTLIEGMVLGYAVVEDDVILFTVNEDLAIPQSYIQKLSFSSSTVSCTPLFTGELNFSVDHPIETTVVIENQNIKKVYWVDGINQPRMINICKEYEDDDNNAFDFCQNVEFTHTFTVEKFSSGGEFPVGTIQYCFSYFNLNGQETNLIECSPLYYLSPVDRGLPADGKCNNSFKITIENADSSFEYIRLYSIVRTSENATPNCKIVGDFKVSQDKLVFVDMGTVGSTIDPTALYFIGGKSFVAGTLAQKDNTLFLGEITNNSSYLGNLEFEQSNLQQYIRDSIDSETPAIPVESVYFDHTDTPKTNDDIITEEEYWETAEVAGREFYSDPVNNSESSRKKKGFKSHEGYRLGFVAQKNTGEWSDVIWIGDYDEECMPGEHFFKWGELPDHSDTRALWRSCKRTLGFRASIPSSISSVLKSNGFKNVAPVVVFPQDVDRKVLCQGILFGTVYNVNDRLDNSPFVQADWRARLDYTFNAIDNEIQVAPIAVNPLLPEINDISDFSIKVQDFKDLYGGFYYRDANIIDFYSPDIEMSETDISPYIENTKLRIVGFSNLGYWNGGGKPYIPEKVVDSYFDIQTRGLLDMSTSRYPSIFKELRLGSSATGTYSRTQSKSRYTILPQDLCFPGLLDIYANLNGSAGVIPEESSGSSVYLYLTYLWHRSGSLNNQNPLNNSEAIRSALYNRKCVSEIQYGLTTYLQPADSNLSFPPYSIDINTPKVFDSNEISALKIPIDDISGNTEEVLYYGNIDRVQTPFLKTYETIIDGQSVTLDFSDGYPITYIELSSSGESTSGGIEQYEDGKTKQLNWPNTTTPVHVDYTNAAGQFAMTGKDPVRIKYKSTKHAVFSLKGNSNGGSALSVSETSVPMVWQNVGFLGFRNLKGIDTWFNSLDIDSEVFPFTHLRDSVLIGELYKEFNQDELASRFGGTSSESLANNKWVMCGEVVPINTTGDTALLYKEGDTYIGRYDCLKTYPFTQEDQNSIVSIYSTELESRVNLDLRYDKNRGLQDNTLITPQNFNLFNRAGYDQTNQFFTYQSLNSDRYTTNYFPNMVTWSLEKSFGEDVDTWTSIPLTSTHTLDGDKGRVTKLITWGDNIFAFQEKGFAQLLYNSRVQIPVSDGQPIEIANSMKMAGKRYISQNIGCFNKWSVISTPLGIYFIDDFNRAIYNFNGQLTNLSQQKGFDTWMDDHYNITLPWTPLVFGLRTYYDSINKDVYFSTSKETLVYSEKVGNFISFMDYCELQGMFNVRNKYYTLTYNDIDHWSVLWELWAGNYNELLGNIRPYWLTFVSNTDPTVDKIYNTLDWRSTTYTNTDGIFGTLKPLDTFDTIRVWNDYQDTLQTSLELKAGASSNLKKKFNVFRAQIPRDKRAELTGSQRDRIRSPWAYVQLAKVKPNYDLMVFNDLTVNFFE